MSWKTININLKFLQSTPKLLTLVASVKSFAGCPLQLVCNVHTACDINNSHSSVSNGQQESSVTSKPASAATLDMLECTECFTM